MAEKTLLERFNGGAVLFKLFVEIVLVAIFLWTFCIVRDLPATYVSKAEAKEQHDTIQKATERQLDRIFIRIDDLNNYIRGKGK